MSEIIKEMKNVLVINSSARTVRSQSRKLTEVFVARWKGVHTHPEITFRELGNTDVPHIDEHWINAAFKSEAYRSDEEIEALKMSDLYISELKKADIIVLGSPMYNWSIPSALKAYIDQVVRVNETWKRNPDDIQNPYIGLLQNKTVFLLLSRGAQGYEKGEYNEHIDFQTDYLKRVFNVMGIRHIHVVTVNGESFDADKYKMSISAAHRKIVELIDTSAVEETSSS